MADKLKNISILIPDGENLMTIRVIQCLSQIRGIKIYVLSTRKYATIRFSRFVTKFIYRPENNNVSDWVAHINNVTEKYSIDVIMPVFETGIRKLVENRNLLIYASKVLIPKTPEQFEIARNKWLLYLQLEKIGVPSPKSYDLIGGKLDSKELLKLNFPALIKPKWELQGGGKGIRKLSNLRDLENFQRINKHKDYFFIQEYNKGKDLGCNVLCKDGEILAYSIQLGTLFQDQEFKPQIGLEMIQEDSVYKATQKLMKSLKWTGVAHIDFLYDQDKREFFVLEINPRYWLTLQASIISGVNFPWLYCLAVLGEEFEMPLYKKIEYLDLKGLFKTIRKNPLFLLKIKFIWNNTPIKFMFQDPFMNFYHLAWSIKNKIYKKNWIEIN
jgi:predicted ATP-grasp superfamily ATP-dependent carboligase